MVEPTVLSQRPPRDLQRELAADASQFGFFQAARILGLGARKRPDSRRGRLPERLRFRTLASLSFPASELTGYKPAAEESDAADEMTISFMGLTGPSGALPTAYTELLLERRQRHRDDTMHAFFDVFSHRAASLFFEAWCKYRSWINVEAGERDGFTRNLLDLGGVGLSQLRQQMGPGAELDERMFVYYAGLLSQKPLSAQSLLTLVEGFFGVSATLEQFAGQWLRVPVEEQSQLGAAGCELGMSAFAGDRIWDRQTKLKLRLGPLRRAQFDSLQPHAAGAQALRALMKYALGHGLAAEVCLVLDRRDVAPAQLGSAALSLGGDSWMGRPPGDPDDMRYTLLE
ncbi:type VI secretion system baseplate subunit TssG [Chromobacterium phragmitis]|uniref:type VI secretion system baseplate subunit TssG n=1 Tax=Chromobacterium phragmitis TaxID=2202141 RepID=UPI000DED242E|nr:type VI secretion system baseplate subunit TssG [Chromobacterium phragmitis]AXE30516.1 type VI secretion system baseplate subunit TssG [Chromobacterium phragmitis]